MYRRVVIYTTTAASTTIPSQALASLFLLLHTVPSVEAYFEQADLPWNSSIKVKAFSQVYSPQVFL